MLRVNSKEVNPGDTFLALQGIEDDGHNYIEEAIDKGAVCIIASQGEYSVKTITVNDTRTYLSNYLKELYIEKLDKIRLIGISGTRGKTTTGDLIYQLLNNLGSKTAYIGTNGFYMNDEVKKISSTTPDIYEIYLLINKAIENECENIIIEVSSKAITQRHVEGLRFDMVIFTNFIVDGLNEEEIQTYLNTKIELFKMIKKNGTAIINSKDPYYQNFALPQNNNVFYGSKDSDYQISNIGLTYDFTEFDINEIHVEIPLLGSYNIYNYLAAYVTAKNLHFPDEAIANAQEKLKQVDGRYQGIKYNDSLIIIDYAYDKNQIESIIKCTREFAKGRIITLIGSGGEVRENQRSQIGKMVTKKSDYAIFTTDNPRHEEPEDIIDEMTKEIQNDNYEVIVNRKEAIKHGINMLENYDILLVLGKGHEETQIIGSDEFPFKDYNEVIKNIKR